MKTTSLKFLCMLLSALMFGACAKDEEVFTGNILGKVTDANTGDVLQGATVTIMPGGLSRTTGSDGTFEFLELEPRQYEIQASKKGYVTNNKSVTVLIGKDIRGDIQLAKEVAKYSLSTNSLDFGKTHQSQSFNIINEGNISFNWSLSGFENIDCLEFTPTSGTLQAGKSYAVKVNLLREKLVGSKEFTILVNVDKQSKALKIEAEEEEKSSKIALNTNTLNFGKDYSSLTFDILNEGNIGAIDWKITEIDADWIEVSPQTGTTGMGKSSTVKVDIDREKLPEGEQTTTILVNSEGESQRVTINATGVSREYKFSLSTDALDFGTDVTSLTFNIKNEGNAGNVSWKITDIDVDWLKIAPLEGSTAMGKSSAVKVELDREKLPEGKQSTTILVNSDGESYPLLVSAEGAVKETKISLSTDELDFGADLKLLTFDIKNEGNAGNVSWKITDIDVDWLKIAPLEGSTAMGKSSAVKVELDREKLPEGKQSTTILVNSDGESYPLLVSAEGAVKETKISLSTDELDFGADLKLLTFDIKNEGNAGDVNWSISYVEGVSEDWVTASPTSGTIAMGKSATVQVTVNRDLMQEGFGLSPICVDANGESYFVWVHAEKKSDRYLEVTPSALVLGTADKATFSILSHNGATSYALYSNGNADWAYFSEVEGVIPEYNSSDPSSIKTLTIYAEREGLPAGDYSFTLIVRSDLGDYNIPVTMTVEESDVPEIGDAEVISCHDDLEFTITSCKASGTTVTLNYVVENIGNSLVDLPLWGYSAGRDSHIYDDQGNEYKFDSYNGASLTLGSSSNAGSVSASIPSGVKIKGSVIIKNVSDAASAISNITLRAGTTGTNLVFKNVAIEGRTPVSLKEPQTTGTIISCSDDFEFTLVDCKRSSSNTVTLSYRVKNITTQPKTLNLWGYSAGRDSYIYDDQGNEYKFDSSNGASLTLGSSTNPGGVQLIIPGDVLVNGSIVIKNVDENATEFSNITLRAGTTGNNLVFKNVQIR